MDIKTLAEILKIPELPDMLGQVKASLPALVRTEVTNLTKPIDRILSKPGKLLRPVMMIAAAKAVGISNENDLLKCCAAIELAHTGTLVHDDIIDDSNERRGIATINSSEGEDTAILVGDFMLSRAVSTITMINNAAGVVLASTIAECCEGQVLEIKDLFNFNRTTDDYFLTIKKKTAAMMAAVCQIGGLCAGANIKELEALADFGTAFGTSFQIIDDLLDLLSEEKHLGKPAGNDLKEGVYTLPIILALKSKAAIKIKPLLKKYPQDTSVHQKIIAELSNRNVFEECLTQIKKYNQAAEQAVNQIKSSHAKNLGKLPALYLQSAIKKQSFF